MSKRLEPGYYIGEKIVSFTACIMERKKVFVENSIFKVFEEYLLNEIQTFNLDSPVYLFMPDHLHVILQGNEQSSNLLWSMDLFKQKTGFWFSKNKYNAKWQKSY